MAFSATEYKPGFVFRCSQFEFDGYRYNLTACENYPTSVIGRQDPAGNSNFEKGSHVSG